MCAGVVGPVVCVEAIGAEIGHQQPPGTEGNEWR
jgi:hypothetical protein